MNKIILYAPDETAELLGLSKQTLAKWRMEGTGPKFLKFGNRVRYPEETIRDYIAANIVSHTGQSGSSAA